MKRDLHIVDVTLRDGSHAVRHSFTEQQVRDVAKGLDQAGIEYFEVSHGDGLGGSSLQYGFSAVNELKLIEAASDVCSQAKAAVLLVPGIGTKDDLEDAVKAGAKMVRVATHVTEADVAKQHIELGRNLGLKTVGFLMMAHMAPPEKIVEQAKLFESYGAEIVYVTDSAGALLPHEVTERVSALKENLSCEIGFHAHNNLSLATANTMAAVEAGATYIDGSLRCLGAGSGNAQTEVLTAVFDRLGYKTGVDLYPIMDVANDVVAKLMPRPQEVTKASLIMGYSGVYSSFLLFAQEAAKKFNVDERDILVELGKMQAVGGQEDLITEVARELANQQLTV
ncbi:4-hydroxy-2-oxovalerate aldolase [Sporosarcina pasteurii]|uniref:4-hydroxy-2-oxovalerate aldolase n=1 Tax=Sporosarcina pasteurii TaxID=1474 RepID=A0A380BCR2_SPOPA|nr:4-hydroxy-2-oxovalerate aldolase [Sporosarcina pasteurii]MDS9472845.1 4-hydroxy-2-oxovalerate aldolase [Sporosarcina pasteurii]QBQ06398.1 4-hydroxy-2-oxovalerate aldolase [Sporosarcina pasteurii]SUI98784.1 4-hydroxy-2-oxovalerate aldolase [Sporosarcina pasteurii]